MTTNPSTARCRLGTVVAKQVGQYTVEVDGRRVACAISNKLRKELVFPIADPASFRRRVMEVESIRQVDPVAVGDQVEFDDQGDGSGLIRAVHPRRSKLSRRAPGAKPLEQVIVANPDQVLAVVAAAEPELKWNLVDRYLVDCEAAELPALVCITKLDRVDPATLADESEALERAGYAVLRTSALDGRGIEALRQRLAGRLTVLIGKSGVGKTSLLNALEPGLGLRVQAIGEKTGKGKHTTTSVELHTLTGGGWVVDTPGMREFALWQVADDELDGLFPEFRPHLGGCRFAGCAHRAEPGCAVRAAVERGEVTRRRYDSYLALRG